MHRPRSRTHDLSITSPTPHHYTIADRSFSVAASTIWNRLPSSVKNCIYLSLLSDVVLKLICLPNPANLADHQHRLEPPNHVTGDELRRLLLLGGKLLTERCRTDDLLPSIPISCLPPCCMDPKVQGLDILIHCSQPGGSWATNGLPPVCWWS